MGNKTTFRKVLRVGNLPSALVTTARTYDTAADTKDWKPLDGCRLAFVGFKLTDKQAKELADGAEIPSSFAVQVPMFKIKANSDLAIDPPRFNEFINCLAADYQDRMISASANKTTTIDPLDWSALVTDYFDTTRGGLTQATLKEWVGEEFLEAIIFRQEELNTTAAADGRAIRKDSEMKALARGFQSYLLAIMPKDAIVAHGKLRSTLQTLNKLVETGHLSAEDECMIWFQEKIGTMLRVSEDELVADI